jgi:hypothetical protein
MILILSINCFSKEQTKLSIYDYEMLSDYLIIKQKALINYIGKHKINLLDENLNFYVYDVIFLENLLLKNIKYKTKNQYFLQLDSKLDNNIKILIKIKQDYFNKRNKIIKNGKKTKK